MDRSDYLNIRLQKDFYDLLILRKGGKSAREIAGALEVTASGVMGSEELRKLREESSRYMRALIEKELSFDRIKEGDSFVKHLPAGFGPELVTKIVEEYKAFLKSDKMAKPESAVCALLLKKIEKESWRSGLLNMSEGISLFLERTAAKARDYRACARPADYSQTLADAYAKAGRSTLLGKLSSGNTDNIIALRSCMVEAATLECENATYNDVADFLQSVADNAQLRAIAGYVAKIREAASQNVLNLPEVEPVAEYDALYGQIFPVGFYSRNIEKVDVYKAFYMLAMYALARYENELKSEGYLKDGEIRVFSGFPQKEPAAVLSGILDLLSDFCSKQVVA